jgi:D-aspartate ligase
MVGGGQSMSRIRSGPRPTAAVLGDMDLVRPLARAGIRSAVVAVAGDPTRFSRHAETIAIWDPDSCNDDLVEPLVAWGLRQGGRPVLYYQWDGHLQFVSRHRHRLERAFRFVLDDSERVAALLDKERFLELSGALALPVPPARSVDARRSTAAGVGGLRYPLVVKPVDRTDDRWKHFEHLGKARRVGSSRELELLWPRLVEFGRPVLLQELVPGPESRVESYHVFVSAPGRIAAEFTGRKVRTIPAEYGATTALVITSAPDVIDVGRSVVERLRLTGVAKLDFKRAPDGRLFLLEVNPRFNLWHHPGAAAGVNIPALVHDHLDGKPLPPPRPARAGVGWCSPYDLSGAGRSPAELLRRLRFDARCETKALWSLDDPLPLAATLAVRGAGTLRRAVRRAVP